MKLYDTNLWVREPEGFLLSKVEAQGSYLHVVYTQVILFPATTKPKGYNQVDIYLNDLGREVLRTTESHLSPVPEKPYVPTRRERFTAAFWFIIYGLEEMFKCLKNSSRN